MKNPSKFSPEMNDDLIKGSIINHKTMGEGTILEFYEFYNTVFVDVKFKNIEKPIYMTIDNIISKKN